MNIPKGETRQELLNKAFFYLVVISLSVIIFLKVRTLVFDLFVALGATDEQLDFPILYASGRDGWAVKELDQPKEN